MDRRERERILAELGPRDATELERAEARRLSDDLAGSPLLGRPLRRRPRNFRPPVDSYVVSLGGPLAYMRRLREIEDETKVHEERLATARDELAAECDGDGLAFAKRWRELAEGWDFSAINELIDRHNRFFPVESRLPMDPRTGDFQTIGGRSYRRTALDAGWILERFPPEPDPAAA
jgi:hypothetical protein